MAKNTGVTSYLNTLIFCIVAKAVTIFLLGLLLFDVGKRMAYLILTVEIGLIAIIIYALVSINKYDNEMKKSRDAFMKAKPNIRVCPDYFTKYVSNSTDPLEETPVTLCKGEYTTPDENRRYTYKFDTSDINIENDFGDTMEKVCDTVLSTSGPYASIAWTDLKARCNAY
jgi:hypothetical protein